jgi:cyclic pyranopterin phosphate synthase
MTASPPLIDRHGRAIRYLRVSVTDRCDLRCRYCMAENMRFLPRSALLSLDEMALIVERFIARGVTKVRLTGGEPLVRTDAVDLIRRLGRSVGNGLDELVLTTNGTSLGRHAHALFAAGIRRINVSLDSLDPATFRHITRHGDLMRVLDGIAAAREAGLAVKINAVALKGLNDHALGDMLQWCIEQGHDLTLIETMPVGHIDEDRADRFIPLPEIHALLAARFPLVRDTRSTGGPARYWRVEGTDVRLGLISPLTDNFCASCNRVRLTTDGTLYTCLGHEDSVDLKHAIRSGGLVAVDRAIDAALATKPQSHDFRIAPDSAPAHSRHMSVTGG